MSVIDLDGVSKFYGDVVALNEVTLSLDTGITGLVGPNGAGKTTLLGLLTGQLWPDRGQVRVLGEQPWRNPQLRERVGFVPETLTLWEERTGRQHADLAADLTETGTRERAGKWLERVGLGEDADRAVEGYSRGMRQRLKLAMALVHEPELLILDEPFAGLDPVGRREMMELLTSIDDEGRSILFSSHVLHEIEDLTRQVAVLVGGRIVAEGDVHGIRELMDQHPHKVRIRVDEPRRLAEQLVADEGVVRVRVDDPDEDGIGEVLAETRDPGPFYDRLRDQLLDGGYAVEEILSPDDNLQAVFNYLTRGDAE
jgi:ABC-2 type transport system ATP-binding protein